MGIILMPTTGEVNTSLDEQNWKPAFTHDGEIVQPGYTQGKYVGSATKNAIVKNRTLPKIPTEAAVFILFPRF
ncbi:MAG: hypothetical protein LBS43_00325 [Prevotellaceae bacterium]|jgi:hypothetical protein|nr:hypothetical protein [Prevotellaceae bacterium]